jgi:hypothetical protein
VYRDNLKERGRRYHQTLPDWLESCFEKASYSVWALSLVSFPLMWFDVAFILRLRRAMSVVGGSAWIENQVGFGQILALLIWVPVMVSFTLTLSKSRYCLRKLRGSVMLTQTPQFRNFSRSYFRGWLRDMRLELRRQLPMKMRISNFEVRVWEVSGQI